MTTYPPDNFYQGHSLGYDLNRSGKDEFLIIQKQLKKLGIKPTHNATTISLEIIHLIHQNIRKYGKNEINNYLQYLNKKKITGTPIPPDISLAYHSFDHLMQYFNSYVTAQIIAGNIFWAGKKIIGLIKRGKNKTKNPLDKEAAKMIQKIVKKETDELAIKIEELQKEVKRNRSSKNKKRTKIKPKKRKQN